MFKKSALLVAFFSTLTALPAYAKPADPVWTNLTPSGNTFVIEGSTVTISDFSGNIWWYNGNISNQSAANIETVIETQFGLSLDIDYVSQCDSATSACTGATASTASTPYSNTFSSTDSFNLLAIHFGQGELLFSFDTPINTFSIGGLPRGLSNYRAYMDVSAIPEPSAYGMMLLGLAALTGVARRQSK